MDFSFDISLPPKGCSPNVSSHQHWTVRHKAIKEHRAEAHIACLAAMRHYGITAKGPIRLHVHFWCAPLTGDNRYRPLDKMNAIAALKAAVDGLVDANLIPSDSHKWLSWGEVTLYRTKEEHGGKMGVTLAIEFVELAP